MTKIINLTQHASTHDQVASGAVDLARGALVQLQGIDFLAACSGGNDSIALIQFLINRDASFGVIYNNTGWAHDDWPERMEKIKEWLQSNEIPFYETKSEGMLALVERKKGWPMPASRMQFCTQFLKEGPTLEFLEKFDPEKYLTICTGRRREESQNRADLPEYFAESPKHGMRECWNPLYAHNEKMRNALIAQAGFEVLPHSSRECYPCVCSNKKDLAKIPKNDPRIDLIEITEIKLGFTKNKKPRTMFRPYRVGGGIGIRQAVEWGHGEHGWKAEAVPEEYIYKEGSKADSAVSDIAYEEDTPEGRIFQRQCDGGYCGS